MGTTKEAHSLCLGRITKLKFPWHLSLLVSAKIEFHSYVVSFCHPESKKFDIRLMLPVWIFPISYCSRRSHVSKCGPTNLDGTLELGHWRTREDEGYADQVRVARASESL